LESRRWETAKKETEAATKSPPALNLNNLSWRTMLSRSGPGRLSRGIWPAGPRVLVDRPSTRMLLQQCSAASCCIAGQAGRGPGVTYCAARERRERLAERRAPARVPGPPEPAQHLALPVSGGLAPGPCSLGPLADPAARAGLADPGGSLARSQTLVERPCSAREQGGGARASAPCATRSRPRPAARPALCSGCT
jgi:hypothetical protein